MTEINPLEVIRRHEQAACDQLLPINIESIIADLGILLDKKADLDSEVSGQIESLPDGGYKISVNKAENYFRRRFTMAHELGHYLLHKALIGKGIGDSKAYRSTPCGEFYNKNIGQQQETEANQFAANLLMPWSLIDRLRTAGHREPEELAKKLQVSKIAFCIRAGVACD